MTKPQTRLRESSPPGGKQQIRFHLVREGEPVPEIAPPRIAKAKAPQACRAAADVHGSRAALPALRRRDHAVSTPVFMSSPAIAAPVTRRWKKNRNNVHDGRLCKTCGCWCDRNCHHCVAFGANFPCHSWRISRLGRRISAQICRRIFRFSVNLFLPHWLSKLGRWRAKRHLPCCVKDRLSYSATTHVTGGRASLMFNLHIGTTDT